MNWLILTSDTDGTKMLVSVDNVSSFRGNYGESPTVIHTRSGSSYVVRETLDKIIAKLDEILSNG